MSKNKLDDLIFEGLTNLLSGTENWGKRWEIASYVSNCAIKGFVSTIDDVINCANRYLAGKRKITPPGTAKRKRQFKEQQLLKANLPQELLVAIDEVLKVNEKAIEQFKNGNEKAINALIGQVMRKYKTDASVIKDLLIERITI